MNLGSVVVCWRNYGKQARWERKGKCSAKGKSVFFASSSLSVVLEQMEELGQSSPSRFKHTSHSNSKFQASEPQPNITLRRSHQQTQGVKGKTKVAPTAASLSQPRDGMAYAMLQLVSQHPIVLIPAVCPSSLKPRTQERSWSRGGRCRCSKLPEADWNACVEARDRCVPIAVYK